MRFARFGFCCAVLVLGCGDRGASPAVGRGTSAIVGGSDAPAMSAVVSIGGCSGTLIAPNLVLTAGHCVANLDRSQTKVTSVVNAAEMKLTTKATASLTSLKDYEHTCTAIQIDDAAKTALPNHDIALMRLGEVIAPSEAQPIEPRFSTIATGDVFEAAGFGATCPTNGDGGCTMEEALTDGGAGQRRSRSGLHVTCVGANCPTTTGAGDHEWGGESAISYVDSGGPALDANGKLVGIASREWDGAIYTRIDVYRDLIVGAAREAAAAGGYPVPAWAAPDDAGRSEDAGDGTDEDAGDATGDDAGAPVSQKTATTSGCASAPGGGANGWGAWGLAAMALAGLARRRRPTRSRPRAARVVP